MIKLFTKKRKGFTLIELVVVIAILGILAALAIPRLTGARKDAAINAHNTNVRMIESAISVYEAQNGKIPASLEVLAGADVNLLDNATIKVPKGTGIDGVADDAVYVYTPNVAAGTYTITPDKVE